MKLYLDSKDRNNLKVSLFEGDSLICSKELDGKSSSGSILSLIEEVLKDSKVSPSQIEQVEFHRGPGSYTGTRVSASIANAFSLANLAAVNGKNFTIDIPAY